MEQRHDKIERKDKSDRINQASGIRRGGLDRLAGRRMRGGFIWVSIRQIVCDPFQRAFLASRSNISYLQDAGSDAPKPATFNDVSGRSQAGRASRPALTWRTFCEAKPCNKYGMKRARNRAIIIGERASAVSMNHTRPATPRRVSWAANTLRRAAD